MLIASFPSFHRRQIKLRKEADIGHCSDVNTAPGFPYFIDVRTAHRISQN
jgi:hypothetical protein